MFQTNVDRWVRTMRLTRTIFVALLACLTSATAARAQGVIEYYETDAIGSVRAVTDAAGTVIARHDYFPFGEEFAPPAPSGAPVRFAGKERDTETGLDYFGARHYSSKIGRFTTVDPLMNQATSLLDPQRWNRYAHSLNNPLRFTDPNGRETISIVNGKMYNMGAEGGPPMTRQEAEVVAVVYGSAVAGGLGEVVADVVAVVRGLFRLEKAIKEPDLGAAGLGKHAGDSIPARSADRKFTPAERTEVNAIGSETGCHTCGTKIPGTKSGNFVPDHQPPSALNPGGQPQRLYPQCLQCSREQGLEIARHLRQQIQ